VTAAGPDGHVRGLARDMPLVDSRAGTHPLQVETCNGLTSGSTVRFGHVRGLAPGMAGTNTSAGANR
jgi:hypothetical protein